MNIVSSDSLLIIGVPSLLFAKALGLLSFFDFFFNLKQDCIKFLTSLIFPQDDKLHIEKFDWWTSFKKNGLKMGGSASSQSAGPDGMIRNTDQRNIGLVNVSGEGSTLEAWLEIASCAGIIIIILYIIGFLCHKRRQKRMARFHAVLRGITVNPEAARVPVLQSSAPIAQPPPAYPTIHPHDSFAKTSAAEAIGSKIMSQYA